MGSTITPPPCVYHDGRRPGGVRLAGIVLSLLVHLLAAILLFWSFTYENSMSTPRASGAGRSPIMVTLLPVAKTHSPTRTAVPPTPVVKLPTKPSFKAARSKTVALPVKRRADAPRPHPTKRIVVHRPAAVPESHVRLPPLEAQGPLHTAIASLKGTSKAVSPKAASVADTAKPVKPLPLDYLMEVSRLIDVNLYYPSQAKRDHDQGSAIVHIVLARDGTVLAVHVIHGTDYPSLDQEAAQVVLRVHKFPGLPADVLAGVNQFAIDQPIRFHLY